MRLSVVVVVYNMVREAPRTLFSLSAGYQDAIDPTDYEIIVVENGSSNRLDPTAVESLLGTFRYFLIENGHPSPASAVNFGLRHARGEVVGVMIDGARIATPGLLSMALRGTQLFPRAVVASHGWYLGSEFQGIAMLRGYNQRTEDALLTSIDWPTDGYRLFEIGTVDESSDGSGWTRPPSESNALFMRKELWEEIRGMDEAFDYPGGGFVNLDTYLRACQLPGSQSVILLGEGTFHQFHGGIATNAPPSDQKYSGLKWRDQYVRLRGRPFSLPTNAPVYLGKMPSAYLSRMISEEKFPFARLVRHLFLRGFKAIPRRFLQIAHKF